MSKPAKILSIDPESMTMIIDWGTEVLNHDIPLYILENPRMSMNEMREVIEDMRPPAPVKYTIPTNLLKLVEKVQPGSEDASFIYEDEVSL